MKFRLNCTPLEDRTVPATLRFNSLLDNTTSGDGLVTLREAITAANNDTVTDLGQTGSGADTIRFDEALNGGTVVLAGTRLTVLRELKIEGPSQGVTISGNDSSQVFYFDGRTNGTYAAELSNLTVTRGYAKGINVLIDGIDSGNYGGGILNDQTSLTLDRVTVSNNVNLGDGGGIYNWKGVNSTLILKESLFVGNTGRNGGGIHNWSNASITAGNTTFYENTSAYGGAIFQDGGAVSLTNITASRNQGGGGFLYILSGMVAVDNSIVWGNFRQPATPDEVIGTFDSSSSHNIIGDPITGGGLTNGTNGNQVGIDPLLGPRADNGGLTRTHLLNQNSPALGKASTSVPGYVPYDQRGTPRDQSAPDIGAYEVQHPLATVGAPTTLTALYQPKPSATANEAFVKGLYQSTLLRAPDAAGLAGWVSQLNAGTPRSNISWGFVNSIENRTNQVTFFYRYFLKREPDTAGLNGWVDVLRGGANEVGVMIGFVLSDEFTGSNNNTQFVNLMYYAILGRQADTAGFNGWVNALNAGMSRNTVVNAFARSDEAYNRVIGSQFQTYLKRYPSVTEVSLYRTFLATNTFGAMSVNILGSAEFFNNAAANLT
jgi:hypothetical protein